MRGLLETKAGEQSCAELCQWLLSHSYRNQGRAEIGIILGWRVVRNSGVDTWS